MPDVSMCPSQDCPVRGDCYRNEASGTVPNDRWQSWSGWTWRSVADGDHVICDGWDPAPADTLSRARPAAPATAAGEKG